MKVRRAKKVRPGVEVAALSDVGCHRENNEDRFAYWEPSKEEQFRKRGRLAIVADGMGGIEGGQIASKIAVETVEKTYAGDDDADPRALLISGFETAHRKIQEYARSHPLLQGMGTTCTAVALLGGNFYYVHMGDSRLYLSRGAHIYRLSRDHSYVGRLVEQGVITAEDALSHPHRNILTAALGAGAEIFPEAPEQALSLEDGDVLILCTDGLWTVVNDEAIQRAVSGKDLKEACESLIRQAKEHGGPDNITVQLIRYSAHSSAGDETVA